MRDGPLQGMAERRGAAKGRSPFVDKMVKTLSNEDLRCLQAALTKVGTLRLARACTGSNVATAVAQDLVAAVGIGVVKEMFICDTHKHKRICCRRKRDRSPFQFLLGM